MSNDTVKDSSIWFDPSTLRTGRGKDPFLRMGVVKFATADKTRNDIRYLVEIQDRNDKININCRMMRRFGGVYNYEDVIYRGYSTNDIPDPIQNWEAKAGDIVIVAFLNGEGREGVILGGITHAARSIQLDPSLGPQYQSEFNGIKTSINADGEWTLTFRGQPTNLSTLKNVPREKIAEPMYDTVVGTTYMKLDKTGSWIINDNANSDPQLIHINKTAGTITVNSGQISLVLSKTPQSVDLICKTFAMTASTSVKINSPKVAIGTEGIELLNELTQLIDALGKVIPISPVGPCTALSKTPQWPQVEQIKSKINQIKGTL
jgi:hypothetical protein